MTVEKFRVFVEENSHYADETARREIGEFANFDDARKACQKIVDDFLAKNYKEATNAAELYQNYTLFGEDAFIVGDSSNEKFSAWEYAKERCRQIGENEVSEENKKSSL